MASCLKRKRQSLGDDDDAHSTVHLDNNETDPERPRKKDPARPKMGDPEKPLLPPYLPPLVSMDSD